MIKKDIHKGVGVFKTVETDYNWVLQNDKKQFYSGFKLIGDQWKASFSDKIECACPWRTREEARKWNIMWKGCIKPYTLKPVKIRTRKTFVLEVC